MTQKAYDMNLNNKAGHQLMNIGFIGFFLGGACLGSLPSLCKTAWSKMGSQTEIHVMLLGQPCSLQGPFDEGTLKAVHAIGPAQLYPTLGTDDLRGSVRSGKKALEKALSSANLPSLFDRYRQKLIKRLEAQIAFLENLEWLERAPENSSEPSSLLKVGKRYLKGSELQQFESLARKVKLSGRKPPLYRETVEQLFDLFNEGIEPDPESEFHRTIKKLNIQYTCSFEEAEGPEED